MAKLPKYRLQALFDIREKEKEEKEDLYAQAMRAVAEEERRLEDMKEHLKSMKDARVAKKQEYSDRMAEGALNIDQIRANDRHLDRMKQEEAAYLVDINRQKEAIVEAEDAAELAKEEMLKATQDFKALEKHKEKWIKQVKRELALKEEDAVEDIAQAQYFARMLEERGEK